MAKNKTYIIFSAILLVIIILLVLVWLNFFKKAGQNVTITIDQGESTRQVAQNLREKKVIFSAFVFSSFVYTKHLLLQPGDHEIAATMNLMDIAHELSQESKEARVTIPEGYRLTQIDQVLAQKGLIQKSELIKIAAGDEGYLFPDTYRFPKDFTVAEIRQEMIDNYNQKVKTLIGGPVTRDDLIIASIVEREAKFDADRAPIAGVYLSRLDLGMKLDADPTIQYGKGSWEPITVADYSNFQSPYNTYLHAGLPPTPICNPGLKSIAATLSPQKDGSLYFFTDKNGKAVFSKTLEEHQAKLKN